MTGEQIKRQRLMHRMSVGDLANKVGVHKAIVLKWENNEITHIKPNYMLRLVNVFPSLYYSVDCNKEAKDIRLLNAYHSADENVKQAIQLLLNVNP